MWSFIILIIMTILYITGSIYSKRDTEITENYYYSPGNRPSITKLRIDKNGISLDTLKIKPNGKLNTLSGTYETIQYDDINSIKGIDARVFLKNKKEITALEIKTITNKHGVINFRTHKKKDVYRLLRKYLKDRWKELYYEDK